MEMKINVSYHKEGHELSGDRTGGRKYKLWISEGPKDTTKV
jgi:hypothetical protein